ncbi:YncE family protein [Erythrobacter sp. HL-111]|uniref:Vgb family protein n=1 Tax=Erythrobacter sp. HL-111 TaxID=1798193 RepID=UPI0006DB3141|nr:YncE family protein [Erythrobacter sp. HL-111]KPP88202.1 MAG: virginiamycin B lyase Vgb [Erythrobacteraceae bacterium HL-111]SDS95433.1 Streptogramin lyase [Erythrobacter sp. HL-111]
MKRQTACSLMPVVALAAACTQAPQAETAPAPGARFTEQAIDVPGFADFLAVDGDRVWVTNDGRVEQWSRDGLAESVPIPRPCGTMAILAGSLWVANCADANLYRIGTRTGEVETILKTGIANPRGETNVVAGAGSVWVPSDADGTIARINPASNEVEAQVDVAAGTFFLAFGEGALWAVSSAESLLQRIDPATNAVTGSVELGRQPGFLVAGEGAVWVQEQGEGTVARVDPATLEITGRAEVGETLLYGDIDTGEGKVWLRTTEDQTFVVIDARTLEIIARVGRAEGSGALRHTPEGIWTSAHDVQTLTWWTPAAGE